MTELEKKIKAKIPGEDTGIQVKRSLCAICSPGHHCGVDCYVKDGRIIRVEGTEEHPYNHGKLCTKGSSLRNYIYRADRIKTPLKRVGERGEGKFEPISWDEALDEIAKNLNAAKAQYGPESVIFFAGYPKHHRAFLQRLAMSFGSPNYCTESSTCSTATIMAQQLTYGAPAAPDNGASACIMMWSTNPAASKTLICEGLFDRLDKGDKADSCRPSRHSLCGSRRHPPAAAPGDRWRAGACDGQRHH